MAAGHQGESEAQPTGVYPTGGYPTGANPTNGYPTAYPHPAYPPPYPNAGFAAAYPGGPGGPASRYPPGPMAPAGNGPGPARAPGMPGIVVASSGAAIALLGLFLNWYASGGEHVGVKEIARAASQPAAPGLFHVYFGWALWVVLAVAILAAISANVSGSAIAPLALAGGAAAVASTVLTYSALDSALSTGRVFDHAAIGLWLVLIGPIVLAAGAMFAFGRPIR